MNPELVALLAETGFSAVEGTSLWDLTLPLPLKRSSCVSGATYALRSGELVVTVRGRRFSYADTPISTVLGLIRADSPGGFYNRYLRGTE